MINIVGGGFAGAVLALHLTKQGAKPHIYADKIGTTLCAEGISLQALDRLKGVFDPTPFIGHISKGAQWQFPGTRLTIDWPAAVMERDTWIPAMLDAAQDAGATLEKTRVKLADLDGLVAGCDGPGSQVAKSMGAAVQRRTGYQMRVASDQEQSHLQFVTDEGFGKEYGWWFARGDVHNVGILGEQDGNDVERLRALANHFDMPMGKVEAYPIAFGGSTFAKGNRLLLGDAAGMTNPLTKGGMAAVIHAAPLAAGALIRGEPERFQTVMQRHPMIRRWRLLAWMRCRNNRQWQRTLQGAPAEIHVGQTKLLPIAARMLARQPWLALRAPRVYREASVALHYSW